MYTDLIRAGIKPENIIYMTYTSDVTSKANPYPGMIFTDPADNTDGDWAKYGCFEHVDYTDDDINEKVFLAILSGDAETVAKKTGKENPKVLSAGPDDTVFTYFIDHGGDDIICVGPDYVSSASLVGALEEAHKKQLYGKWVWFMEACHSGSMFPKLPTDINIYVMTSSDAHHDAYMSNCPPEDYIGEKHLSTCMAGLWDNLYLDYLEQNPDCTIGEIFDSVKASVAEESDQNVSEFGDMTFRDLKVAEFFGKLPSSSLRKSVMNKKSESNVPVPEVPLHLAKWAAIRADDKNKESALKAYENELIAEAKREVELMRLGSALMNEKAANNAMNAASEAYSVDCVRELSMMLVKKCGHKRPFPAKQNNMLRNICLPGLSVPNVNWDDICM